MNQIKTNVSLFKDFTERYLFVVQDCVLGFHWSNSQAAIHLFVLYYVDPEKETVCHKAFAYISNHMTHDTVAAYSKY